MQYRWDDFLLDREGSLLTRGGRHVDVTRKVLDCITHLIRQRHRVVEYDELSRAVWGHDRVSHQQLSQVVRASRLAIGDDGQAQRLIRNMPGIGYRWVGPLQDATDPASAPQGTEATRTASDASARSGAETAAAAPPPEPSARSSRVGAYRLAAVLTLVLATATIWGVRSSRSDAGPPTGRASVASIDAGPLSPLWEALWQGRFEAVESGLAALPAELADKTDARLLAIYLDIDRGRFAQADAKLVLEQTRAGTAADPVSQARLFTAQAFLNGTAGRPAPEVLAPAQSAVRLLESTGDAKPSLAMGEALSARGYGYMKTLQLDSAARDLVRARDMLREVGDARGAANAADTLARIYMRMGRFHEALTLMTDLAEFCERTGNPVQEIFARNAATKIQIELLRWNDALASNERSLALLKTVPRSERRTRVLLLRTQVFTGIGRMREAASLIEEVNALRDDRYSPIPASLHHLAAGDPQRAMALASAADAFEGFSANEPLNLESREGALLIWLTAAQSQAKDGRSIPPLPQGRLAILQAPTSSIGHIARGRWLWSQGREAEAEAAFREALSQARRMGHLSRMLEAGEPLIDLLLARGDLAAAERVHAELWRQAPAQLARDYRANLLSLKLALAAGDRKKTAAAYRTALSLAGERALPASIEAEYRRLTGAREPTAVAGR